jgi:hypothetical protein
VEPLYGRPSVPLLVTLVLLVLALVHDNLVDSNGLHGIRHALLKVL